MWLIKVRPILYGLDFLDETRIVGGSLDTFLKVWHASGGPAFWSDTMSVQIQSLAIVYLQRERNFFFYFKCTTIEIHYNCYIKRVKFFFNKKTCILFIM